MPMPRIQPMWMDLSVGALTSMPGVQTDREACGGIEKRGMTEMIEMWEKSEKDGVGIEGAGVRLLGRKAWRCKNHWNGVFCPKWVLSDGAACGACMVSSGSWEIETELTCECGRVMDTIRKERGGAGNKVIVERKSLAVRHFG